MKHLVLVILLAVAFSFVLAGCGGPFTVETGATYDFADASEDEVRAIFVLAVREKCAESGVGISVGLASALRALESAGARKSAPTSSWRFRIDQKTAHVFPSGKVSGNLLRDLASRC